MKRYRYTLIAGHPPRSVDVIVEAMDEHNLGEILCDIRSGCPGEIIARGEMSLEEEIQSLKQRYPVTVAGSTYHRMVDP